MRPFFEVIKPLVFHPERIAIIAAILVGAAVYVWLLRRRIPWLTLTAGIAWFAYALWEAYCKAQDYNIRVDLFLIYPVLTPLTLAGIVEASMRAFALQISTQFSLRQILIAMTLIAFFLGIFSWLVLRN